MCLWVYSFVVLLVLPPISKVLNPFSTQVTCVLCNWQQINSISKLYSNGHIRCYVYACAHNIRPDCDICGWYGRLDGLHESNWVFYALCLARTIVSSEWLGRRGATVQDALYSGGQIMLYGGRYSGHVFFPVVTGIKKLYSFNWDPYSQPMNFKSSDANERIYHIRRARNSSAGSNFGRGICNSSVGSAVYMP